MRTKTYWKVNLVSERHKEVEVEFAAFWSPDWEGCSNEVGKAAAAQAWHQSGKTEKFAAVKVEQVRQEKVGV